MVSLSLSCSVLSLYSHLALMASALVPDSLGERATFFWKLTYLSWPYSHPFHNSEKSLSLISILQLNSIKQLFFVQFVVKAISI